MAKKASKATKTKPIQPTEELKEYTKLMKRKLTADKRHKAKMKELDLQMEAYASHVMRFLSQVPSIVISGVELKHEVSPKVATLKDAKNKPRTEEMTQALFASGRNDLMGPDSGAIKAEYLKALKDDTDHTLADAILALLNYEEEEKIKAKLV